MEHATIFETLGRRVRKGVKFYLHLPRESVINSKHCHGCDPEAGHDSSDEVGGPLRLFSGQFRRQLWRQDLWRRR